MDSGSLCKSTDWDIRFNPGYFGNSYLLGESLYGGDRNRYNKWAAIGRPDIYFDAFPSAIRFTTMPRVTMAQPTTVGTDSRPHSRSKTMPVPV